MAPLDGRVADFEVETRTRKEIFWASSPEERLRMLAEDLRKQMPLGFKWDFDHCHSDCGSVGCAMGLSNVLYGTSFISGKYSQFDEHHKVFGLDMSGNEMFYRGAGKIITPAVVARRIDQYLASRSKL